MYAFRVVLFWTELAVIENTLFCFVYCFNFVFSIQKHGTLYSYSWTEVVKCLVVFLSYVPWFQSICFEACFTLLFHVLNVFLNLLVLSATKIIVDFAFIKGKWKQYPVILLKELRQFTSTEPITLSMP